MTKIRDITITDLIREFTDVDVAAFSASRCWLYQRPVPGVYNIREKINSDDRPAPRHRRPRKHRPAVANSRALVGDNSDYKALIEYVETHDITDPSVYAYVESKVDIQNFIDWNIVQALVQQRGPGQHQIRRERTADGKGGAGSLRLRLGVLPLQPRNAGRPRPHHR